MNIFLRSSLKLQVSQYNESSVVVYYHKEECWKMNHNEDEGISMTLRYKRYSSHFILSLSRSFCKRVGERQRQGNEDTRRQTETTEEDLKDLGDVDTWIQLYLLYFDLRPGPKNAIPRWYTGRKWHIPMASNRKRSRGRIKAYDMGLGEGPIVSLEWCIGRE